MGQFQKAGEYLQTGNYEEAVREYDEGINESPNHYLGYYSKAFALHALQRYADAVKAFDNAIECKPDFAEAYYHKGNSLYYLGKLHEALKEYENTIRIKPDHEMAHKSRDDLANRLGNQAETSEHQNDIFISYSWKQKPIVHHLYEVLTRNGLKCWIDKDNLEYGGSLFEELTDALVNCKTVLCCLSKDYLQSPNCEREFNFSMLHNKKIIPILMCKNSKQDREAEFGSWPAKHKIFFQLSDALYIQDIYDCLNNRTQPEPNSSLDKLINQLRK